MAGQPHEHEHPLVDGQEDHQRPTASSECWRSRQDSRQTFRDHQTPTAAADGTVQRPRQSDYISRSETSHWSRLSKYCALIG